MSTATTASYIPTSEEIEAERAATDYTRALVHEYAVALNECTARAELADEIGAQLAALADDFRHACESRIRMPDDVDAPFDGMYERPAGARAAEEAADSVALAAREAWGQAGAWRRMRRQLDARRIELVAELDWLDDSSGTRHSLPGDVSGDLPGDTSDAEAVA